MGGGGGGKVYNIVLGGGQGGPNSQQAHDVVTTSIRRLYVASTLLRRHMPTRFFNKSIPNNCISHLKKSYIIQNSRIDLRGIVLPVPSNQIKIKFIIIFPSAWYICVFSNFS